ncbi:hypothetical protein Dimus_034712 [Dionaea muscipula]
MVCPGWQHAPSDELVSVSRMPNQCRRDDKSFQTPNIHNLLFVLKSIFLMFHLSGVPIQVEFGVFV